MNEAKVLLEIIQCFIENRECIISQEVDEEKLYQLAVKHKMSNFLLEWSKKYVNSSAGENSIRFQGFSTLRKESCRRILTEPFHRRPLWRWTGWQKMSSAPSRKRRN